MAFDVAVLRFVFGLVCRVFRGRALGVAASDHLVAGNPARLYLPPDVVSGGPLILFVHGGGFISCGLDTHEALGRRLAVSARARVLALSYPLAPEAPAPAQLEAVLRACRAIAARQDPALGPTGRLWLAGDSAGAYLALRAAADLARQSVAVDRLLLFYPLAHVDPDRWAAPLWQPMRKMADWAVARIRRSLGPHPYPPPPLEELRRLPPTAVISGGVLDPVAGEAHRLATDLRQAGVPVIEQRHAGMFHGALCVPVLYPWAGRVIREAVLGTTDDVRR